MIHSSIVVKSGVYYLRKMTKTQVRVAIRDEGRFHGFLCGNRVNPSNIADGWRYGIEIDAKDTEQFEAEVDKFETGLRVYTPKLGEYPHYYQIIENTKDTRNQAHSHRTGLFAMPLKSME